MKLMLNKEQVAYKTSSISFVLGDEEILMSNTWINIDFLFDLFDVQNFPDLGLPKC